MTRQGNWILAERMNSECSNLLSYYDQLLVINFCFTQIFYIITSCKNGLHNSSNIEHNIWQNLYVWDFLTVPDLIDKFSEW